MGFRNESCVEIGREDTVLGMFTPDCHVALEDIHQSLGNLEFTFLASVLASSSVLVMTQGVVAFLATPVTNLHLCQNMPTFIALIKGEVIKELLNVYKVTFRLRRNKQRRIDPCDCGCLGCPDW